LNQIVHGDNAYQGALSIHDRHSADSMPAHFLNGFEDTFVRGPYDHFTCQQVAQRKYLGI
jgi:hypothetical protein